jgi:hypothetical protein
MKVVPTYFLRKCNCNNNKVCMYDLRIFCNYKALLHNVFFIFNPLLPIFSNTLGTSAVKFTLSTSEHITNGTRKL